MCRCTARGGCESERGARVRNRGRMKGSRRKPAISYAKQSGNTPCMHTASPEPRSKIIEHGPFHRKVAWKGRRTDFSRSNPPLPPLATCFSVLFPAVFPSNHFQRFEERVHALHVPRYSNRAGNEWNLSGWMAKFDEICLILMTLWLFFLFIIDLGERRKRKEILFQGYRG